MFRLGLQQGIASSSVEVGNDLWKRGLDLHARVKPLDPTDAHVCAASKVGSCDDLQRLGGSIVGEAAAVHRQPAGGLGPGRRVLQDVPMFGVLLYLMQERGMSAEDIEDLLHHKSGLLGVSGISSDMRMLRRSTAPVAREFAALFAYRIVRKIGSLAAAPGGVDAIVFTAGNSTTNAISGASAASQCRRIDWSTWIMPTDEERMIGLHTNEASST